MTSHGNSVDKVAEAEVRLDTKHGNTRVIVGSSFPHVVSTWGSHQDAHHAKRRIQLWLMGVLMTDRKQRGTE